MTEDVRRQSGPDRFEIVVDGAVAGLAQFVDRDGRRVFFHTEVGDEYGGRGLAGVLVDRALRATREEGLRVVPVCPYVKKFLQKHPEHQEGVDRVTPEDAAAVRAASGV
jgi:predicted GNAT family acetyltransferase